MPSITVTITLQIYLINKGIYDTQHKISHFIKKSILCSFMFLFFSTSPLWPLAWSCLSYFISLLYFWLSCSLSVNNASDQSVSQYPLFFLYFSDGVWFVLNAIIWTAEPRSVFFLNNNSLFKFQCLTTMPTPRTQRHCISLYIMFCFKSFAVYYTTEVRVWIRPSG